MVVQSRGFLLNGIRTNDGIYAIELHLNMKTIWEPISIQRDGTQKK